MERWKEPWADTQVCSALMSWRAGEEAPHWLAPFSEADDGIRFLLLPAVSSGTSRVLKRGAVHWQPTGSTCGPNSAAPWKKGRGPTLTASAALLSPAAHQRRKS